MSDTPAFPSKLAGLADKIADEASANGVGLAERIDAFKVLTAYYVGITRINAKPGDPEEDEGQNFGAFQRRLAAASGRT
jgi:hypothetical protein